MTGRPRHLSIVPDPGGTRVVVLADGDAWRLPAHEHTDAADINAGLRARLGFDVVTTGCVRMLGDVRDTATPQVFGHWHRGPDLPLPAGARWIDPTDVESLPFAVAEERVVLRDWFAERKRGATPLGRLPWAHEDWYDEAAEWCRARLTALGRTVTGPVEQVYARPWSCTLRVPTSAGFAYFKAVVPCFGHEPPLAEALAVWFPDDVPAVLAVDRARDWMLTADFSPYEEMVPTDERFDAFAGAVRRYVELVRAAGPRADELVALGCPDRRLAVVPALFEDLLTDGEILRVDREGGVTAAEYDGLLEFARGLPDVCDRLAAYGLPETVQNIDFWHGNIAFTPTGPVYYDWSEAVVAHPLAALRMFLFGARFRNPDAAEVRNRLLDVFLGCWESYAAPEELREAYRLAQPIGIIARALCWRATAAHLEPERRFLMAHSVPNNMRFLLDWAAASASRSIYDLV